MICMILYFLSMAEAPCHTNLVHLILRTRSAAAPNLLHHCPSFFSPPRVNDTLVTTLSIHKARVLSRWEELPPNRLWVSQNSHKTFFLKHPRSHPHAAFSMSSSLLTDRARQLNGITLWENVHSEVLHHVISPSEPMTCPSSVHAVVIFARPTCPADRMCFLISIL